LQFVGEFFQFQSNAGTGFVADRQQHSTLHDDEVVLEIPVRQPRKKVAQRGKGFSKEEDRTICSAFLNVSKDPITGRLV
jgi:hypothetical protein